MGECGLRGGYVELVNMDPAVMEHIFTIFSKDNAPTTGQIALSVMANPPQPGEQSYDLYKKELGMEPDTFYCLRFLEDTGVITTPGSEYGQKDGTYHIRFCIMTLSDTIEHLLTNLVAFHTQFMNEFS
ncbi:hypothetical protein WMY93_001276 [Mugilogobius chulae]|uniref:Uncharacterized protein n=1 Tax=Mugilogobius chulae TaxID=88201 RepID=A0AAW0Q2U2_9GOBI